MRHDAPSRARAKGRGKNRHVTPAATADWAPAHRALRPGSSSLSLSPTARVLRRAVYSTLAPPAAYATSATPRRLWPRGMQHQQHGRVPPGESLVQVRARRTEMHRISLGQVHGRVTRPGADPAAGHHHALRHAGETRLRG